MNNPTEFEDRASSSLGTHEGEPSESLCDRLSRTRDTSQRQLPTDHDYAVSTREYQTDQSSLKPASTAAGPVLEQQQLKQTHRLAGIDTVTPYQRFGINRSSLEGSESSQRHWTEFRPELSSKIQTCGTILDVSFLAPTIRFALPHFQSKGASATNLGWRNVSFRTKLPAAMKDPSMSCQPE
jgi:hypothetical protein